MTQELKLDLASGASLTLIYFSEHELRLHFAYTYRSATAPGQAPEVFNLVRLIADYADGRLAEKVVLSMHVILPQRLGQEFFAGMDISPGAKTYLEFTYKRVDDWHGHPASLRLVEICKGARDRVNIEDQDPALMRPIVFPFPIPDRIPVEFGHLHMPFLANSGEIARFDLPVSTLRLR